jgi:hypothetical protein
MVSAERLREIALSLPETVELDHHGFPSFRVHGKIFATLPDGGHAHVMLDEGGIRAAVSEQPQACSELWWGKRLAAVRVDLDVIDDAVLTELVTDAWRRKAPRRLV